MKSIDEIAEKLAHDALNVISRQRERYRELIAADHPLTDAEESELHRIAGILGITREQSDRNRNARGEYMDLKRLADAANAHLSSRLLELKAAEQRYENAVDQSFLVPAWRIEEFIGHKNHLNEKARAARRIANEVADDCRAASLKLSNFLDAHPFFAP